MKKVFALALAIIFMQILYGKTLSFEHKIIKYKPIPKNKNRLVFLNDSANISKVTISGVVKDISTNETLIGVNIFDLNSGKGTITDYQGNYNLTLPPGKVELQYSFIGLKTQKISFHLRNDTVISPILQSSIKLKELEVFANKEQKSFKNAQMSNIYMSKEKINTLPSLMGEKDVIKALQLMPGIQSGNEGATSLYVRGGGPDQNLILLDGVPIYHASHLFGFASVFNTDVIKNASLIKGGFPARYAGRLSSVIDIKMNDGNFEKLSGNGNIGLISSKIKLEGPVIKGKTSFLISGRRTYIDILTKPFSNAINKALGDQNLGKYFFYDFNSKVTHRFSDKDQIYFSGYFGKDRFDFSEEDDNGLFNQDQKFGLEWGNVVGSIGWKHALGKNINFNLTLNYSQYNYSHLTNSETRFKNEVNHAFTSGYSSGIQDWIGKWEINYYPNENHAIKLGVNETYHHFLPGKISYKWKSNNQNTDTLLTQNEQYSNELFVFAEDEISLGKRFKGIFGINAYQFTVEDTSYYSIQPRCSARYLVTEKISAKGSYSFMNQGIHLLSNPSIGLPTDLWVSSTKDFPPQNAHQLGVGVSTTIQNNFDLSIEGYYKKIENAIDYVDGVALLKVDWQNKIDIGKGWAYGIEFLLEKNKGKTTGWIGYTLSWANMQYSKINSGKLFPANQDRRNDLSLALCHKFNNHVDVGITWVYGTGKVITNPIGKHISPPTDPVPTDEVVNYYDGKNNNKEQDYHRLDFEINFTKEKKWGTRTWNFSIYNVYNRQNPFFTYNKKDLSTKKVKTYQLSILPIMPSISYSFKF